jgi:hypothetical protein
MVNFVNLIGLRDTQRLAKHISECPWGGFQSWLACKTATKRGRPALYADSTIQQAERLTGTKGKWGGSQLVQLHSLFSLLPGCPVPSSFLNHKFLPSWYSASPQAQRMQQANHGLKSLKPWAYTNHSSFKLMCSGILSQQWRLTKTATLEKLSSSSQS